MFEHYSDVDTAIQQFIDSNKLALFTALSSVVDPETKTWQKSLLVVSCNTQLYSEFVVKVDGLDVDKVAKTDKHTMWKIKDLSYSRKKFELLIK